MRRGVVTLRSKWQARVSEDNANKLWLPAKKMRRVTTLRSKQYGEYRLSALNYSGESIKNREYLIEFEAKFEKSLKTEWVAWEESISEKIGGKQSR